MPLMLVRDAMMKALYELGPQSRVYRHCEYAYGTLSADLVDYESLVEDERAGTLAEPPSLPPVTTETIKSAVDGVIAALLGKQDK